MSAGTKALYVTRSHRRLSTDDPESPTSESRRFEEDVRSTLKVDDHFDEEGASADDFEDDAFVSRKQHIEDLNELRSQIEDLLVKHAKLEEKQALAKKK